MVVNLPGGRPTMQLTGGALAVLIDQDGGRVQRLGPPHWPLYPAVGFASRSIPTRTLRFPRENLKTLESTRTMRLMISFLGKK